MSWPCLVCDILYKNRTGERRREGERQGQEERRTRPTLTTVNTTWSENRKRGCETTDLQIAKLEIKFLLVGLSFWFNVWGIGMCHRNSNKVFHEFTAMKIGINKVVSPFSLPTVLRWNKLVTLQPIRELYVTSHGQFAFWPHFTSARAKVSRRG